MDKFKKKNELYDYLETYASKRKSELDRKKLDTGLIKSYIIETARNYEDVDLRRYLNNTETSTFDLDDGLFGINLSGEIIGYCEPFMGRYYVLYSGLKTETVEPFYRRLILDNFSLDSCWFAGDFFDKLREIVYGARYDYQYLKIKFEYINEFEKHGETDENELDEDEFIIENKASKIVINERIRKIREILPELRDLFKPFYSQVFLRVPSAAGKGGHEIYNFGKVTNRSNSFLDHKNILNSIIRIYKAVTEIIEDESNIKFEFEAEDNLLSMSGKPVLIKFIDPLDPETFENFVSSTFVKNVGPFRIAGNPIKTGDNSYVVYGVDRHLYGKIDLDINLERFLIILHSDTCGNTLHRLITNTQTKITPALNIKIGNKEYREIITNAMNKNGNS
ncbi:MAG: hypothetical protein HWN68_18515 [Desulfobacterales bacterium]|nr:hypothetical protein [Desulfobacterales bacterium]